MPHELTLEMGGAGGEFSPPLEAPQGAGHQLTAAAGPLENHINWSAAVRLSKNSATSANRGSGAAREVECPDSLRTRPVIHLDGRLAARVVPLDHLAGVRLAAQEAERVGEDPLL